MRVEIIALYSSISLASSPQESHLVVTWDITYHGTEEIGKYITLKRVGKIHIRQEIRLASCLRAVDFLTYYILYFRFHIWTPDS